MDPLFPSTSDAGSGPFTGEIYFLLSGRQRGGSQVPSCANIYLKC